MGYRKHRPREPFVIATNESHGSPHPQLDTVISLLHFFGLYYVKYNDAKGALPAHILIQRRIGHGYKWTIWHQSSLVTSFRDLAHSRGIRLDKLNTHTLDVLLLDNVLAALAQEVLRIPCYVRAPLQKAQLSNIGIGPKAYTSAMEELVTIEGPLCLEVIKGSWSEGADGEGETTISRLASKEGRNAAVTEALLLAETSWPRRVAPAKGKVRRTTVVLRVNGLPERELGSRHRFHQRLLRINTTLEELVSGKERRRRGSNDAVQAGAGEVTTGGGRLHRASSRTTNSQNHPQAVVMEAISVDAIFPHQQDLVYKQVFRLDNFEDPPERWYHGRIYCNIQQLSEEQRRYIVLGGHPTVELDIGSFHPRLCYHLQGLEAPSQPYKGIDINGESVPRELVKLAVNIALNVEDRGTAIAALRGKCEKLALRAETGLKISFDRYDSEKVNIAIARTEHPNLELAHRYKALAAEATHIIAAVAEQHQPISRFLFKSAWRIIHRIDSEICLKVMEETLSRGIPIISIHDSWIVPQHTENEVRNIIIDAYHSVLASEGGNSFHPIIKKK